MTDCSEILWPILYAAAITVFAVVVGYAYGAPDGCAQRDWS